MASLSSLALAGGSEDEAAMVVVAWRCFPADARSMGSIPMLASDGSCGTLTLLSSPLWSWVCGGLTFVLSGGVLLVLEIGSGEWRGGWA
jgi:hypothetical protein